LGRDLELIQRTNSEDAWSLDMAQADDREKRKCFGKLCAWITGGTDVVKPNVGPSFWANQTPDFKREPLSRVCSGELDSSLLYAASLVPSISNMQSMNIWVLGGWLLGQTVRPPGLCVWEIKDNNGSKLQSETFVLLAGFDRCALILYGDLPGRKRVSVQSSCENNGALTIDNWHKVMGLVSQYWFCLLY